MAVFKCKMCGGTLEVEENAKVCECAFCGRKQTLPSENDEQVQGLYNRANVLRMKGEFDKAGEIYEKIATMRTKDPEVYWGMVLCKYGIEYVEDPATFKRVPTCHRASYDAVTADEDYKAAIANADISQRSIYEAEAKAIEEIQKGIIAISQNEKPYDVFICYKETDDAGQRTVDSAIANDIYHQLTQEGFKVFYAAITLEDKLGQEYEPYIFAALNSAKVMLTIGTKPEYFNAVWVKNEWSRYLKIMSKDRSKLLIPCYRDMDPYELPEEFAHLQAQDMSKIGFINDVVRGIKKVIAPEEKKQEGWENVAANNGFANTETLLKRAFMFLEDNKWEEADEYCERVLDQDPENTEAYLVKLLVDEKVENKESLKDQPRSFAGNSNYKKIIRFGSEELKNELDGYIKFIEDRNEEERKRHIYEDAKNTANRNTVEAYRKAIEKLRKIKGYKDTDELIAKYLGKIEEIKAEKARKAEARRIAAERKAEEERIAAERNAEEERIAAERKAEEERIAAERKAEARKKKKRIILIIAAIAAGIVLYNAFKPCELEQYIKDNGTKTVTVNGVDFNIPKGYNDLWVSDGKTDPGELYASEYYVSADYEDKPMPNISAAYIGRTNGKFDIDACVDNIIENDWVLRDWGENRKCSEVDVEGADSAYLLQVEHPKFKNPSYEEIEYDASRYYYCILLIGKNVFYYGLTHPLGSIKYLDDVMDEKTICELAAVSVKGKQELSGISSEPFVPSYENVNPGAKSFTFEVNQETCFVYDSNTVKEYQKLLEKNGCEIVSTNKDIFSGKVTYKKGNLKFDMKYKFGSDRSEKFDGELTVIKK